MSEHHPPSGNDDGLFDSKKPPFDEELNMKAVLVAGAIGIVVTILSFVTMWWLFLALRGWEESKDPAPSPFQEQIQNYRPPAPNLQEFPPTNDIEGFHAWEDDMLNTYGVVDEEAGVARIPIERAMEVVLERGFPTRAGAELEESADAVEVPEAVVVGDTPEVGETLQGSDGTEGEAEPAPGTDTHTTESGHGAG